MGKRQDDTIRLTGIRVRDTERSQHNFHRVSLKLLRCLFYLSGSYALIYWFVTLFEIGVEPEILTVSTLLLGIWYFFVYLTKKTKIIGIFLSLGILIFLSVRMWNAVYQGICEILNTASQYILDYYNTPLGFLPAAEDPRALLLTVLLLQALLMLWLGSSALKGKAGCLILTGLLLLCMGLMVNRFPAGEAVFLWIFSCFSMRVTGREGKGGIAQIPVTALGIGTAIFTGIMVLLSWLVIAPRLNPVIEDRYTAFREFQSNLEDRVRGLWGGNSAGGWQGMVQNGVLTNNSPAGGNETALSLTVENEPEETIYLKGFIGGLYQGSYWEEISDETFQEAIQNVISQADFQQIMEEWGYSDYSYSDFQSFLASAPYEFRSGEDSGEPEQFSISYEDTPGDYVYAPYLSRTEENAVLQADVELMRNGAESFRGSFYPDIPEISADQGYTSSLYVPELTAYAQYVSAQYLYIPSAGLEELQTYWNSRLEEFQSERGHYPTILETTTLIRETLASCSYSRNLDPLPEGEDFVQYFLFDQHRGFCTHFATTAVLLYRMTGYPARYATGYIARPEEFQENENGGWTADIPGENAHAWVEIYQNAGTGWLPVEMTPGYGDTEGNEADPAGQQNSGTPAATPSPTETADSQQSSTGGSNSSQLEITVRGMPGALWSALLIFLVLALLLLVIWIRRLGILYTRNRRFRCTDRRQAVRRIVQEADRMLSDGGFHTELEITDQEYAGKVQAAYPDLPKGLFSWFIRQGEAASYGNEKVTDKTVHACIRVYRILEAEIRKGRGRLWKFWWYFIKCYR